MSKLKDNLNSDWFRAKNRGAIKTIYVESDIDIPFWKEIFVRYAPNSKFTFKSSYKTKKGKDALLKEFKGKLGNFLLLCVDSDYHYLLQDSTINSRTVNNSQYIFQTYTYSIENYKCWHKSLNKLPVRASLNDRDILNFETLLKDYSSVIYELFVYYINAKLNEKNFFQKEFLSIISFGKQLIPCEIKFDTIQEKADAKIQELKKTALNVENTQNSLTKLGVNKDNVYLFISGHFIFDKIVEPIMKQAVSRLKKMKQNEMKDIFTPKAELEKEIKSYNNAVRNVQDLLYNNFDFFDCPLILNIKKDVVVYDKKIKLNP